MPTYDQESSDNWEIGNKLFLFDRRLRLNTALYWIDASDVQFTQSVPNPGGTGAVTSIATNQGGGETYGFELDSQAALTDAVTLAVTYSYTHTEITKGCDDFEFTLNTGGVIYNPTLGTVPQCNIEGNEYPLVAEQTASFALNYDSPLSWGEGLSMISNFTTSYEGSKFVQVHNLAETGATTLVNLRLGIRSDNGWRVELFGRNLTDSDTIPLATRWFDLTAGSASPSSGAPCIRVVAGALQATGRLADGLSGHGRAGSAGRRGCRLAAGVLRGSSPGPHVRHRVPVRLQALTGSRDGMKQGRASGPVS